MPYADLDAKRAHDREYGMRPDVRERRRARASAWREAQKKRDGAAAYSERTLGYYLKWRYGISAADYAQLLKQQSGCCAICGTSDPSPRNRFSVDHDHETGVVRGLLCHACNTILGLARDDQGVLATAIAYLAGTR